jgi:hypothetical protein
VCSVFRGGTSVDRIEAICEATGLSRQLEENPPNANSRPPVDASDARVSVVMRTTVTFDDDVAAIIESEQRRTGESLRTTLNRLVRCGAAADRPRPAVRLPELPGRPILAISDVSAVLAGLDDERQAQRDLP